MEKVKSWKLILSPQTSGDFNMAFDKTLFENFEAGLIPPTFRIYSWSRPCISLGYSQKPENELNLSLCEKLGIDVVGRPTGGGIVLHTKAEVTYSLVTSFGKKSAGGPVEILKETSKVLVKALSSFGINADVLRNNRRWNSRFCFSYPSRYEISVGGKKIIGVAQRVGKRGLLQQGSIFVDNKVDIMLKVLKDPPLKVDITSKATSINELIHHIPDFDELSRALISSLKGLE